MRDRGMSDKFDWYYSGTEGLYREGEEIIAKDSYYSLRYAVEKIKGRFIAGEREMKKNEIGWIDYIEFLKSKGIGI